MGMFIGSDDWNEDIESEENDYDDSYSMFMHDEYDYDDDSCSMGMHDD